ncbi:thioredoxin 1 [[Clostridium] fimetarium]|uniref:Thioredoxin n=2 Tax=[Clostridium] fimetarium TaxID=99656 RepID=A0A1I0QSW5_9FIRM|nr:thioredoxin 1 [[Clostridium] fimetarium]
MTTELTQGGLKMENIFNEETFKKEVIEGKGKVLVDFYADWCSPCKMLAPTIEKVAEKYIGKITVGKVNIDECPNLAATYKVMSIPTLILFDNGEKVETIIGLVDQKEVEAMIVKHI